jgi:D-aminoacyl-tRNA deacylase
MRALIQRVTYASVRVDGAIVGRIEQGLLVFVGVCPMDGDKDIEWLTKKIIQLRIFNDSEGRMNLAVGDINGGLLIVSQFTLYADTQKGNRPSFAPSAPPQLALPLYEQLIESIRKQFNGPVATGIFGADMKIELLNDGPVTIWLDTHQR